MNTLAIVGRPNVGKSTLFNRLLRERRSIVDREPGVTRDRVYGVMERNDIPVILIDTGGLKFSSDSLSEEIKRQIDFALEEADIILLMVDGREGLCSLDEEVADYVRKAKGRKVLIINKMDKGDDWKVANDFSKVILDKTFQISSIHGHGVEELLTWILSNFEEGEIIEGRMMGVIGKPNTGKSTYVNAVMGYERSIIKEEPGTTRDSINSYLEFNGQNIVLIDTAGLKRRSKLKDSLEYYSFLRAVGTIEESAIVLILIDSTQELTRQDKRIINWARERETPMLILLSKFDLIPRMREKSVIKYFSKNLSFIYWVPIIPISSITMRRIDYSLSIALKILKRLEKEYPELKNVIKEACEYRPPPGARRALKIYSVKQKGGRIWIRTNLPKSFDEEYKRYLEKRIREKIKFEGIPISIRVKKEIK
ncbi:ribosome biogenesis GTPase Der [candidate division WOR-3 bacterium]|nr:ribosome biogenesis GTPase Der [candidate division WOR-3 bacterium]